MYFAESVLERLFPAFVANSYSSLVSNVRRSNYWQRIAYARWRLGGQHQALNTSVLETYHGWTLTQADWCSLRFFATESAEGFTLVFGNRLRANEAQHYFDYLRNRLSKIGYCLQHAYRELSDQTLHVETAEKYFFRREASADPSERGEQHRPAVTLEYICIDNVPSHCRLLALASGNQSSTPVTEFKRLMGALFKE